MHDGLKGTYCKIGNIKRNTIMNLSRMTFSYDLSGVHKQKFYLRFAITIISGVNKVHVYRVRLRNSCFKRDVKNITFPVLGFAS